MALWEAMAKAFNKDTTFADISQAKVEAVIDALVLVLYADGKASFMETTELEQMLHEMPWTHGRHAEVDAYTKAVTQRVKAVHDDEELENFVAHIAARLDQSAEREKAYEMASRMAHADWQIHPGERATLAELAAGLEIGAERAQAIDARVAADTL